MMEINQMPLSEITAKTKEELISKVIEKEMGIGKTREQAIAIAYAEAKTRGYDQSNTMAYAYHETISNVIGKGQRLNNVLKVPVTLVAEMIQDYHISELPFMKDYIDPNTRYIKVLKDWKEIKFAYKDLLARKIESIPYVMPHTRGIFVKDQCPEAAKKYFEDSEYITDREIHGYVKDFYLDEEKHKLKGNLYLPDNKNEEKFMKDVEGGKVIDVSIGFICSFDNGGVFEGEDYVLTQRDLQIGHLAGLVDQMGKCPAGICGINQDSIVHDYAKTHLVGKSFPYFHEVPDCGCKTKIDRKDSKNEVHVNVTLDNVDSNGLITPSTHNQISGVFPMADDIEKLKTELTSKDAKIKALEDQATSALSDKVTKISTDLTLMSKTVAERDVEIKSLKEEIEKFKAEKKKAEDTERPRIIANLEKAGVLEIDDGIEIKPLKDACLRSLRIAWGSVSKNNDAMLKLGGMPKPSEDPKPAGKMEDADGSTDDKKFTPIGHSKKK